jgi:hypothetical protein
MEQNRITDVQLLDDLIDLAADWKPLATQLRISPATQHAIEGERSRVTNCLQEIIEQWLWYVAPPHTKAVLVQVLRKPALGEKRLARRIENDKDIDDNFDDDLTQSLPILTSKLSDIAARYPTLGLQLGISDGKIKEIESRVVDVQEYLRKMLIEWNKEERPLTDILEAIRSPSIGNMRFAKELEEKWIKDGFLPAPHDNMDTTDGPQNEIQNEAPDLT